MPRTVSTHKALSLCALALVLAHGACSSSSDEASSTEQAAGSSGTAQASGGAAQGGSAQAGAGGDPGSAGAGNTINVNPGGAPQCGGETKEAKPHPFAMYVMMDKSGSMTLKTQTGESKWDAVKGAMKSFVNDPASKGIGVGIQFFPQVAPGVPDKCTSDTECASSGPCDYVKGCAGVVGDPKLCKEESECEGGAACAPLGLCSGDENAVCVIEGDGVGGCGDKGNCLKLPGYCALRDSCEVGDYAKPAQAIDTLPAVASQIVAAMEMQQVDGQTPMGPALAGALQQAGSYAASHKDTQVVVVMVTDGLPRNCTPLDIPSIAAEATMAAGAETPVKTYVVGVMGANDLASGAEQNLDTIAKAGDTSKSFIINAKGDVQKEFLKTLNVIRGAALQCDYEIPEPTSGAQRFDLVNVEYAAGGTAKAATIGHVADQTKCDSLKGGWYYDVAPEKGKPGRIVLCSASCDTIQSDPSAKVDIRLGCPTVEIEVK